MVFSLLELLQPALARVSSSPREALKILKDPVGTLSPIIIVQWNMAIFER